MYITIRYLGISVHSSKLDSNKSYSIGRDKGSDIHLDLSMVSRNQGKIEFKDGQWQYLHKVGASFSDPQNMLDMKPIAMRDQLEIMISEKQIDENTKSTSIDRIHAVVSASNRSLKFSQYSAVMSVLVAIVAGFGGYKYYQANQPMDAKSLLPHVRSKVVEFEMPTENKIVDDLKKYASFEKKDFADALGFCTGFLVSKNIVLTANHCLQGSGIVDPAHNFVIRTSDRKAHKVKRILGFDTKKDFAFVEMEGMESYGFLEFADSFSIGDKVFTVGNAHGQGVAIREGILANETPDRNDPSIKYLRYSAAASPGNSGGPLVDAFGKIVSLVFAKTNAGENYNLGTTTKDLKKGYADFVKNTKPKKVVVKTKDLLTFFPNFLLSKLNLPASDTWYENPEFIEPFNTISFEMSVPSEPKAFFAESIQAADESVRQVYEQILAEMAKGKDTARGWNGMEEYGAKILLPAAFQPSYERYLFTDKFSQVVESSGFIEPPSKWGREGFKEGLKKGVYSLSTGKINGTLVNVENDDKKSLRSNVQKGIFQFSTADKKGKIDIGTYLYRPSLEVRKFYTKPGSGWDSIRGFKGEDLLSSVVGKKGALASSQSPYVRPNSYKNFTVKSFKEEVQSTLVKDKMNRNWQNTFFTVFNQNIESFCLPNIQGSVCLIKNWKVTHPDLNQVSRQNFALYNLSHLIPKPEFSRVDATLDFFKAGHAKNNPMLNDFEIVSRADGGLTITLKTVGVSFNIDKSEAPSSLRLSSGYLFSKKKWVATNIAMIRSTGEKSAKVCGIGVEPKGSIANPVLQTSRSRLKLKDKYPGSSYYSNMKADFYSKEFKSANLGEDFNAFGYCWKTDGVSKDEASGLMSARLSGQKPYPVKFSVKSSENLAH